MKRYFTIFSLAVMLMACSALWAQGPGNGGRNRIYDPNTVTTVTGTVQEVKQEAGKGGGTGTHLLVKTAQAILEVHVGPDFFLNEKGIKFATGDSIEVTGSKVKIGGTDALIAKQIKVGGKELTLRDDQGRPVWAGQGRGRKS